MLLNIIHNVFTLQDDYFKYIKFKCHDVCNLNVTINDFLVVLSLSLSLIKRQKTSRSLPNLCKPGANTTITSYKATGSLASFEKKTILYYFQKRSSLPQHWRCNC
jgi:hypothetical protein